MTNFNIRIISDNVCPWCYIGKARLDKAISLYQRTYPGAKDDTFTITWAPFYLDPTTPKGITFTERATTRFGADRVDAIKARLQNIGQSEGFNFTFEGLMGPTRDSHRVIQLAKTKGSETENSVVKEIMRSYFEGKGDISSWDSLAEAAAKGGLDAAEVKSWLEQGKGGDEVDREVREAVALGVTGVPHFVIQGDRQVGGAQDVEAFVEQFVEIKEKKGGA